MTPITGNPDSFPSPFDIPDDSDPPAAATFNVANEALADRTAALANGYRALLANTAALKAIDTTLLSNGAIRVVNGLGRFKLNTASSETEQLPVIVAPTVGPGRWEAQDDEAKRQWVVTLITNLQSFVIPSVISRIAYDGWGNGGGGGGGGAATTGAQVFAGGGGGAGAQRVRGEVDVTGGASGSLATNGPGAGGTAGTASGNGGDGGDGDDLTVTIGAVQLIFPGAQGGRGGGFGPGTRQYVVPGGSSAPAGSPKMKNFPTSNGASPAQVVLGPGAGGWSGDNFSSPASGTPSAGARSLQGFTGGGVGAVGATVTNPGGMAGGGGGAGPNGNGGHGGNGGNGAAAGDGANGTAGIAAAVAYSGAGGGGGGSGGNGSTGGASGGAGGAGAAGQVVIRGVH